jgi:hypothetical protein
MLQTWSRTFYTLAHVQSKSQIVTTAPLWPAATSANASGQQHTQIPAARSFLTALVQRWWPFGRFHTELAGCQTVGVRGAFCCADSLILHTMMLQGHTVISQRRQSISCRAGAAGDFEGRPTPALWHKPMHQIASPDLVTLINKVQAWARVVEEHISNMEGEDVALAYSALGDLTYSVSGNADVKLLSAQLNALESLYSKAAYKMDPQMLGPSLQSGSQLIKGGGGRSHLRRRSRGCTMSW